MRVLLVRPPSILGYISRENIQHPINLAQLAAELLAEGIFTRIIDCELVKFDEKAFREDVLNFKPDLIGFTAVTPHVVICAKMAGLAKSVLPDVFTVVGGAHPSVLPAQTLKEFPQFDIVVIGEGERTLVGLCRAIQNNKTLDSLEGIAFWKDGKICASRPTKLISDLDSLKMPVRHLLSLKEYFKINRLKGVASPGISRKGINPTQIFTSRGCWAECLFCSNQAVWGNPDLAKTMRVHSIEWITAEVEQCIRDLGINHFSIEDEMFPSNKKMLKGLCELFAKHGVTWNCNARVDILTKEDLSRMAESGCLKLELGVESGSPRILSLLQKNINMSQIEDVFAWAKEFGIWRTAYLMIGSHPSENAHDLELTKKLVKKIKPDLITFTVAVPYPGTALHRLMESHGLISAKSWENYQYYNRLPAWRTFNMTAQELVKKQTRFLRWFYLNPRFILKKFIQAKNLRQMFYFVSAGFNTFFYLLVGRKKMFGK